MIHRPLFLILGLIFVALAILGAFLPLLPSTPFGLLAAFFFSKSSDRLHKWCLNLPLVGPAIQRWQDQKSISPAAKALAIVFLVMAGVNLYFKIYIDLKIKFVAWTILLLVAAFIVSRPNGKSVNKIN